MPTDIAVLFPLLGYFSCQYRRICSQNVGKAMKIKKSKLPKYVRGFEAHLKKPHKYINMSFKGCHRYKWWFL